MGAQTLKAGVVRHYSVVLIVSGWVRVWCARLCGVNGPPPLWSGLRGVSSTCGATSLSDAYILPVIVPIFHLFCFLFVTVSCRIESQRNGS